MVWTADQKLAKIKKELNETKERRRLASSNADRFRKEASWLDRDAEKQRLKEERLQEKYDYRRSTRKG